MSTARILGLVTLTALGPVCLHAATMQVGTSRPACSPKTSPSNRVRR